jgi:hypothetical protein
MATVTVSTALSAIPAGLRDPLIAEYQAIVQNFLEQRWRPSELSGGLFSEIVYTILDGHASSSYASAPSKPANFLLACRALESNAHVPRSFQILIPRMLPALYEVRNNRSVGHTGGDVNPNHMDSVLVLSMCSWIMGELIRVYHNLASTSEAQAVVEALAEIRIPVIWTKGNLKRVLDPKMKLPEQILLLTMTSVPSTTAQSLIECTESKNKNHFMNTLRALHRTRLVEFDEKAGTVEILPPGTARVQRLIREKKLTGI